jgi:arylformamidase
MKLVDLSHTIENGLVTFKGLPAPVICDYLSREDSKKNYEEGTSFQIGKLELVSNTGTYIDCPFHRYENGKDISEVELERFVDIEAMVIRADFKHSLAVTIDHFKNKDIAGKAVLVHTGWDAYWNTEKYYTDHPYITKEAAEYLCDIKVSLVGIDSHNMDDTRTRSRPAHTILLHKEILIVEHLCNLASVPNEGFTFTAAPPKFKGVGTFPVRAMAKVR